MLKYQFFPASKRRQKINIEIRPDWKHLFTAWMMHRICAVSRLWLNYPTKISKTNYFSYITKFNVKNRYSDILFSHDSLQHEFSLRQLMWFAPVTHAVLHVMRINQPEQCLKSSGSAYNWHSMVAFVFGFIRTFFNAKCQPYVIGDCGLSKNTYLFVRLSSAIFFQIRMCPLQIYKI